MSFRVTSPSRYEGEPVKGSRFIVDVAPVQDEPHAKEHLARVAAEYPDASHHCWAWRIASPPIDRASDDGEPSGSAGRPILAQLTGRDLVDTAVVVTRYFGGTKLGVGGLVRAYGGAAGDALDQLSFSTWVATTELAFDHGYSVTDAVERAVAAAGGIVLDRSFGENVTVHVQVPVNAFDDLAVAIADATSGAIILSISDDAADRS